MEYDYFAADGQAQAKAARLRGIERIKDVLYFLGVDTHARVRNRYTYMIVGGV
jgi:hypothetical protein